ncbi:hypothetical protein BI312_00555 [Xanthomonas citri pv. citri]|nr:hypothetical protein BI314_14285 [Xanthomonas citri pv. citri]APR13599.1 hypothetical protein BI315_00630 [Xanthomonas citri pv. citri]APR20153.1 hypothetical protein BI316_12000 [Xanthomonas citri pv. citri]APR23829.1 hypothetical protein BJD09_05970 [Xanthomonas citri pv. citri]OLR69971.1 hypothetical protein BI312_00555 [Xanthomonas citri pv. citri]
MGRAFNKAVGKPCNAVSSFFGRTTSQLSGAVPLLLAGPLAAWMPPSRPHGWVHGVSRKR